MSVQGEKCNYTKELFYSEANHVPHRRDVAYCDLPLGHLGSHEGIAHGHNWFWNPSAWGILRPRDASETQSSRQSQVGSGNHAASAEQSLDRAGALSAKDESINLDFSPEGAALSVSEADQAIWDAAWALNDPVPDGRQWKRSQALKLAIDAYDAAVRREGAASPDDICLCGDYRKEHRDGEHECVTCRQHAHMQLYEPCQSFRPLGDGKCVFDNGSGMTETMTVDQMIVEIQRLGRRCVELTQCREGSAARKHAPELGPCPTGSACVYSCTTECFREKRKREGRDGSAPPETEKAFARCVESQPGSITADPRVEEKGDSKP